MDVRTVMLTVVVNSYKFCNFYCCIGAVYYAVVRMLFVVFREVTGASALYKMEGKAVADMVQREGEEFKF